MKTFRHFFCIIVLAALLASCALVAPTSATAVPTPTPEDRQIISSIPTENFKEYLPYAQSSQTPGVISAQYELRVDFAAQGTPPPELYGVNGWWTDEDAETFIQNYSLLSPTIVRIPVFGELVEPVNDDGDPAHMNPTGFTFDQPYPIRAADGSTRHLTYAKWFAALRDLNITVLVYIPYLPGWLSGYGENGVISTYPPNDYAEYEELVRAVLNQLVHVAGISPEKVIFEVTNEPDLPCEPGAAVSCFWGGLSMDALVRVTRSGHDAAKGVSPKIRVAGLALCCNFDLLHGFSEATQGEKLLDIITYHAYINDHNFPALTAEFEQLKTFGLPVLLDEYGSTSYWSNGETGARWHAYALPFLWKSGVLPVQFSMSEMPGMHPGFNELGLTYDWTRSWERKPAYWAYSWFFTGFGGRTILPVDAPPELGTLAGRCSDGRLSIWINNPGEAGWVTIRLENWQGAANVTQYDALRMLDKFYGWVDDTWPAPKPGEPLEIKIELGAASATIVRIDPGK